MKSLVSGILVGQMKLIKSVRFAPRYVITPRLRHACDLLYTQTRDHTDTQSFVCQRSAHTHVLQSHSALSLPLQVKLSRLCEQDKILKDLESRISSLKEDKVDPLLGVRLSINETCGPPSWTQEVR